MPVPLAPPLPDAVLARWAPVFFLHHRETYLPVPFEFFIQHGVLKYHPQGVISSKGVRTIVPAGLLTPELLLGAHGHAPWAASLGCCEWACALIPAPHATLLRAEAQQVLLGTGASTQACLSIDLAQEHHRGTHPSQLDDVPLYAYAKVCVHAAPGRPPLGALHCQCLRMQPMCAPPPPCEWAEPARRACAHAAGMDLQPACGGRRRPTGGL